tara:strand:+ start:33380 stop:33718 length:339 start_codon:yes stop_codon:yes gene_type:complete
MAVYSNLTVDQGTDFSIAIDVTDSSGTVLDLTGFTAKGQIRRSFNSSTAVDITCTVRSPATDGILDISLTNAQTNAMKAGRYVYDVEITSSGGVKDRVLEGQIEVMPGVTQI